MIVLKPQFRHGADSIYFGGPSLNARASATGFTYDNLKDAIEYAKLRNVKTHLTLNILTKNSEFNEAIKLAKFAISCRS